MSDTPRTDAAPGPMHPYKEEYVSKEFARQLERELLALAWSVYVGDKRSLVKANAILAKSVWPDNAAPQAGKPIRKGNAEPLPAVAAPDEDFP